MFSAEIYFERRQKLIGHLQDGIILLFGNVPAVLNYRGHQGRFRQDSTFLYYTGIDKPNLACIIDCTEGITSLYGNELTMDDLIWTGPQKTLHHFAHLSKIEQVKSWDELTVDIAKAQQSHQKVHYLPPYSPHRQILIRKYTNIDIAEQSKHISIKLLKAVVEQRIIKQDFEIAQMEETMNLVTRPMFMKAFELARENMSEQEIVTTMQAMVNQQGCDMAFRPICSVNGAVLHNETYHNRLKKNQLLLIDAGAEGPLHYATDITRTIPVDHKFSDLQKELYEVVLHAQKQSIESIKPGLLYRDIHLNAARQISQGLKNLGLMKGDTDEAVATGAHALFFPHGLGHMMGLDVHDMEDFGEDFIGYDNQIQRSKQFGLSALRYGRQLLPNQVITVEPGLYFIPELIDQWKAEKKALDFIQYARLESLKSFGGIRIEDDIVVSDSGAKIIGHPIPKEPHELENIGR